MITSRGLVHLRSTYGFDATVAGAGAIIEKAVE